VVRTAAARCRDFPVVRGEGRPPEDAAGRPAGPDAGWRPERPASRGAPAGHRRRPGLRRARRREAHGRIKI